VPLLQPTSATSAAAANATSVVFMRERSSRAAPGVG
jgi:hypothetical protein